MCVCVIKASPVGDAQASACLIRGDLQSTAGVVWDVHRPSIDDDPPLPLCSSSLSVGPFVSVYVSYSSSLSLF